MNSVDIFKMSLGLQSPWHVSKVKFLVQDDKNNELIAVHNSIQEAVKATGFNRTTIRRNIQGISSSKSFIWTDKPLH